VASLLLPQDLLVQVIAERDDVARDQPGVAEQVVLDRSVVIGSRPVAVDPEPVADRGGPLAARRISSDGGSRCSFR
jgi:hypothetical protein